MVNTVVYVPTHVEHVNYARYLQLNLYLKDTINEGHNRNDLHTKDKFDHQIDFAIVLTHVSSLKSGRSLYSEQNGWYQHVLY